VTLDDLIEPLSATQRTRLRSALADPKISSQAIALVLSSWLTVEVSERAVQRGRMASLGRRHGD